jgi:hypothetical protein
MLVMALAALAMGGCTRSLEVKYSGGFDNASAVKATAAKKIAILPFTDERAWVDKEDEQTKSFVAKEGVWKFGLTFDNREYFPVSDLLQNLFVAEFKAAGYDAVAGKAQAANGGYTLSGRIVNFEFANETGLITVTSRRAVSLALTLTDPSGKTVLGNQLFTENDRENEGMGVLHSTNADKLMNRALKKVVTDVLVRMKPQLNARGDVLFRVTLNGVQLHQDFTAPVAMGTR